MSRVLLLTQGYEPHKVIGWDRAITLIYTGKAEVVAATDEVIYRNGATIVHMPSVIRLVRGTPRQKRAIKFSRMNVFSRDNFRCQYCGSPKKARELNYDHVVPRHLGGRTTWDNIVSSCYPCNTRKRNRTPEQAGMKLRTRPKKPESLPLVSIRFDPKDLPPDWVEWCRGYFEDEAVA